MISFYPEYSKAIGAAVRRRIDKKVEYYIANGTEGQKRDPFTAALRDVITDSRLIAEEFGTRQKCIENAAYDYCG